MLHDGNISVFALRSQVYDTSEELALGVSMFTAALPENIRITWLDDWSALPTALPTPYCLLAANPAIGLAPGCLEELQRVLDSHPEFDAVMPSDPNDYPVNYFSLYGFERFAQTLADCVPDCRAYDGRESWLLLIRAETLSKQTPTSLARDLGNRCAVATRTCLHPFAAYYQNTREECLPLVPAEASCILDLGCADGRFGGLLKQARPCYVAGVEQHVDAAHAARSQLDEVWCGDVFEAKFPTRFDCVTCLDMFEHVTDSAGLLKKIRQNFLVQDGYLLLSLPNAGHWSLVEDLLAGRWDYVPAGLLCNTHLRFFTLHTITQLLTTNGFTIVRTDAVKTPVPAKFHAGLSQFRQNGMTIDEESLSVLQYHVLAKAR